MYNMNIDLDGTITITEVFSSPINFNQIGDEHTISIKNLEKVICFSKFEYETNGENKSRYLTIKYRISKDSKKWTKWTKLENLIKNFPTVDPFKLLFIEINLKREGTNTSGQITLDSYSLEGSLIDNSVNGEETITLVKSDCSDCTSTKVVKPPFIYKVFSITDIEVIDKGDTTNYTIKYRISQDHSRTWTQWEPFTKENITTLRINPIRFFQIEYYLEYMGNSFVKVYDINLVGDFQNVTLDYGKSNVYGIRSDCNSVMASIVGDESTNVNSAISDNTTLSVSNCNNGLQPLSPSDISKLFNPYQQQQAMDTLSKLGSDASQVFGHEVVYFITDPDSKGIDYTFHEYQLYNYICDGLIKVMVDGNNFPDNQIQINQFDLSLFDTFEIHIPKDTFKSMFGPEKRPSKEDFLWFCTLNRMFIVEHSQQFRNFNNSALYYKLMLKKYTQKANVIGADKSITDRVRELTKNSTINELFGLEEDLDKKDVANQTQTKTLTQDVLRQNILVDITKELIENSSTIVSKSHYEMSGVLPGDPGIIYNNFRKYFQVSDNIGFTCWFKLNNYTVNDTYHFINYSDSSYGFGMYLRSDRFITTLNSTDYTFDLGTGGNADSLEEGIWYCYVCNVDQRQRKISQYVYKRNSSESAASMLGSTVLKLLYSNIMEMDPVEFDVDSNIEILGSDMKITNIRLFNDIIPQSEHNKILNQYIIGNDAKYLIFSDTANQRLVLPNYSFSQINPNLTRKERNKYNKDGYDSQSPPLSK